MRIGMLTASVSRSAGGLFNSVRGLSRALSAHDEVKVFGLADEFTGADFDRWPVEVEANRVAGPRMLGYAPTLAPALRRAGLDVLHTHGIWMYPSVAARHWSKRTARPYVVSPRGMLDPWALALSSWKKRLAGAAFERAHLRGAGCLHALCEPEAQAFRAYGLTNPVAVVPNGVDLPALLGTPPAWAAALPGGARVLLFLGRIHPKKGLRPLLEGWREAARSGALGEEWFLVVAGWDQSGHEAELRRMADEHGIAERVRFVGPQFDDARRQSFERADAFVLPSLSEGLPMAVLEAWSYRLPVLMTPECNLAVGFDRGAALRVEVDAASLADALGRLGEMSVEERERMGAAGHRLVAERFTWPRIAEEMRQVYGWLADGGPRPSSLISSG